MAAASEPKKKPRRTAERILDVTLDLFNRFGEPNVSTTVISAELKISPGNLYYHYPAKDELINGLFARYEKALAEILLAADNVRNVEDAWLFFHMLFETLWQYRFLYRDLNDLLSKNRRLETQFQQILKAKGRAVQSVLGGLARGAAPLLLVERVDLDHDPVDLVVELDPAPLPLCADARHVVDGLVSLGERVRPEAALPQPGERLPLRLERDAV